MVHLWFKADDGADTAVRVLDHHIQLVAILLGVIDRVGVERVEHGVDTLAHRLLRLDGIDIEQVQLAHDGVEYIQAFDHLKAVAVSTLKG